MPLDSLGLGLTLDTTLLEKADKTLENMHKNSKLIMQNLTRGISAFNSGAITDFADVLNNVQEALSKMDGTKMSIDYDKKGLEEYKRGINDILDLTVRLSEKFGDMQFYDPKRVNRTDESPREVRKRLRELLEEYKTFEAKLNKADEFDADSDKYTKQLTDSKAEIERLTPSVEKLEEAYEKAKDAFQKYVDTQSQKIREKTPEATDEEIHNVLLSRDAYIKKAKAMLEAQKAYKEEESLLKAQQKLYGDASAAKFFSENRQELEENSAMLRESIKNAAADLAWANKTIAEKDEELLKDQKARDNEEKSRIAGIQSTYKEIRKAIEQGEKELAEAEKRRDTIAKGKGDTSEYDAKIQELKAFLDEKKDIETSWRKSQYWPALEAIDKQFNKKKLEDEYKQRISSPTVAFANQYSKNATSIDEETQAVKMLEAARDSLSNSTAHYDQVVNALNKRIAKHEDHIKLLTQEQKESKELQDSVISRYIREKKEIKELNKVLKELHEKQASTGIKTTEEDKYEQDIIARRQRLWNDVHQIEVDNAKQIAQLKEKYDASVAEEKIQEIIKTNEKEKQEYAKLLDDLYAIEKQKKSMEDAGAKEGDKAYDNILQQEQDLNNRISQLKAKHQNDLDEIDKRHAKKRNDDDVKAFIEAQKEKQKIAEETAKKMREKARKYGTISSASADRLIGVTENAKNINQHKAAIEKLTQVKSSLDNTDKNYFVTLKKIDKALRQHHKALREAGVESNNLMQSHRGLLNIGGQLARRLALAFSVSQLTQYFRKLVEVRGQFEKTEVALTSIIGDNQKAQKLMNQTIALAIKSPFTLQQLTGYTKQLAAYQVSYEELHSTTKMLADVSAGLGVEMDRLILAFGQVKAANYLRATEVRQFTEAGFNILGELAKYYSELEGRMISVGDVQERVTKRMVDFGDVEEIFRRVTSAGGMFYEMQSKQAETLAGQWTNLQDRIDVMLNEIGTDREGLLKGLVRMLASLIDNWEALADVIKIVVGAFVLYKVNLLAVTKAQIANNIETQKAIALRIKEAVTMKSLSPLYKGLGSSMKGLGSAMKGFGKANLWLAAFTAVISSIIAIVKHTQKMKEAFAEQDKIFNENASSLQKLADKYKEASKYGGNFEKKMEALRELSGKLEDRNLTLSVKIEEVDETNIDKVFEENEQRLQKAYDFGKDLGKAISQGMNEAQGNVFGFSFFGENLKEDAEDYGQSMGKLMSWGMQAQMSSIEDAARINYLKMGKYAREYYDSIKAGKRANESEFEWTKRRATALVMISKLESDIVGKNKELQKTLRSVTTDSIELHHETKGIFNNLVEGAGGLANLRKEAAKNPIELAAQVKTEVDKLDYNPATKEFMINDLYAMLHLKVNYVEDPNAQPSYQWEGFKNDLKQSREDLKKFVDESNKSLGYENFFFSEDEIKNLEQFSDALEAIQKKYDENKKAIEQLDGTSDEYSKAEKARLEAVQAELKETAKRWNYDLDKDTDGKGRDERLERLKSQISLIKEMNQEYEKLNKTFSKAESLEKVKKAYADTAKELGLDTSAMDFTDEGTIKSLEDLLGKPEYAANKYVLELQKALDNFKVELGITTKQGKDEELKNEIQKFFDQYDLTLELKKLNIPSELAKSLFDVDYLDLDGLKRAVQAQSAKFIGTDMEQDYEDFLKKINELSRKAQEDEAKEFINFLKNNLDEIKLVQDKGAHNIALADRLFGEGKITAEQYLLSIRQIVEDTNKEVAKINLEKFKDSSTYIKAMGNLAAYSRKELEGMISALQEQVGTNAGNMGADEIRAYYEAIERLVDQYDKLKSPFQRGEINDLIEYLGLQKQLNQEKEKEVALEQRKTELNVRLELLQAKLASQQAKGDTQGAYITQGLIKATVNELKEVDGQLVSVTSNISVISEKVANLGDGMVKGLVVAQKVVNEIANIAEASTKMFDDIKSAADALGADTESGGWAKAGYAMEMVGGVSSELTSGLANLASGNFAGALANVVGIVTKLISGFAKIHDQNYQDIIEAQAKEVERLGKAYEKLEKATEDAYSIEQLQQANKELERNVELQMQALRAMIAAERAKKNTDEEQIAAWNEELEALTQQWEDLKQSLVEGVGGVSDYRSQTRAFVDSWVSAFQETGDGLSGLQKDFREFFDNIIAEQAALRVTEKFLEPFYESLNTSLEDLKLTEEESKNLREEADKIMPELSKALELIWNQLGGSRGEAEGGSLSALQKGIQGITEDTAQIIEAYLNSIRGYVSEQVTHTKNIYRILNDAVHSDAAAIRVRMV